MGNEDKSGVSLERDLSDPKVHKETFSVNEAVVKESRNEIPVGVGGVAVQRIPWGPQGAAMVASGVTHKRIQAQERCLRPVDVPLEGGTIGKFHCSRPCLAAGLEGGVYCPEHDREAFQPIQDHKPKNQRSFNSASITLSESESQVLNDKGEVVGLLKEGRDVTRGRAMPPEQPQSPPFPPAPDAAASRRRAYAPRKKPMERNAGEIRLVFTLDDLAGDAVIDLFSQKAIAALDSLPATNMAAMKKVVAVQEWLALIGRAKIVLPEEGK